MVLGRNYAKWQILDIGLGRKPKMGNGNSKFPKLNGFPPMHSPQIPYTSYTGSIS